MPAFHLTTDFLTRMDGHDLSDSAFRFYLDLLAFAVSKREPSVHELVVFVYAIKRGESTDPYPASALDLLRAGLLTDVYNARGDLHAFLVADAIPHATRTSTHRRPIPDHLRDSIYARDGYRCLICGNTRNLQLDHIIPWSFGGTDQQTNLETLCGPCNARKGDRPRRALTTVGAT